MRILQVTTFFEQNGGVEKAVEDLSTSLAQNHSVQVLSSRHGHTIHEQFQTLRLTKAGGRVSLAGRPISISFSRFLSSYDVDVVHYHLPCPLAVFSHFLFPPRARVSVVTWHHDLVRNPFFNALMAPFLKKFLQKMDAIFVTAPAIVDILISF